MTRGLIWLASYPKSGNTWMRAFIANLIKEKPQDPLDINEYATGAIASSRQWIDEVLGYDCANLSHEEIDQLRPAVYRYSAERQADNPGYHKIHDAWTRLPDGTPLFPVSVTQACLYIVRNPLDVAVSMSHHNQSTIEQTIKQMACPEMSFCASNMRLNKQLRQKILTWSEHVRSWYEAPGLNIKLVRYEDMLNYPLETFTGVAKFLEIDTGSIVQSIEATRMDRLQAMENDSKFKERPQGTTRFFRKGIAGDWQQRLRPDQVEQVVREHSQIMQKLGYLDENGSALVEPKAADKNLPML